LAWLGLANWLPFFWFFLAIRPYLATTAARQRVAFWLCAATVPVVVVGLLQSVFGWNQELNALGGLIRWSMREARTGTSLFDNPNQTAAWLAMATPLVAQRLLSEQQGLRQRWIVLLLAIGTTGSLLLSASRNAISTLVLTWPLSGDKRLRLGVLALVLVYGGLVWARLAIGSSPEPAAPVALLNALVPEALVNKLQEMGSGTDEALVYGRRQTIYAHALAWLQQFPWFGVGEQGFAALYNTELIAQFGGDPPRGLIMHSHSLPLEFALSHGLPALVLLAVVIGLGMARSGRLWLAHQLPASDRSWWLAGVVLIWLHIWDVPFFDSRLNMAGWLVFAAVSQMARPSAVPAGDPEPG
jgi:O-antigen ligase